MEKWVWIDVDGTLIDIDDEPRPYIKELFERLYNLGVTIVVWSAGGHDYAAQKIGMVSRKIEFDLDQYVQTYWWKPWHNMIVLNVDRFYIDDVKEMLEAREREGHETFWVPFYVITNSQSDDWLLRAANAVEKWISEPRHETTE